MTARNFNPVTGDLVAGLLTVAAGVFFLWGALQIDRQLGVLGGPHVVPMTASLLLLALGLAITALAFFSPSAAPDGSSREARRPGLLPFAFVAGGLVYVWLIDTLGYLPASLIAAPFAFAAFGGRGLSRTLLPGIAAAIVVYLLFFQTLGLYDPPGRAFDWREAFGG